MRKQVDHGVAVVHLLVGSVADRSDDELGTCFIVCAQEANAAPHLRLSDAMATSFESFHLEQTNEHGRRAMRFSFEHAAIH